MACSWLINGGYYVLTIWDDPPSSDYQALKNTICEDQRKAPSFNISTGRSQLQLGGMLFICKDLQDTNQKLGLILQSSYVSLSFTKLILKANRR